MRVGIRIWLCLLIAALLLCMAGAASVTSREVTGEAGEKIEIPVFVTDNEGIMGFRIAVDYPAELLCEPMARAGSLTGSGMLDYNANRAGRIEVLWCGSSDAMGEGSLFVLEFTVREGTQGATGELLFSCIQEDTFNEKWEDVQLQFSPVLVKVAGLSAETVKPTAEGGETTAPTEETTQAEETASAEQSVEERPVETSAGETELSPEESSSSMEFPAEMNQKQDEADVPVLPFVLIAVVILGSVFGMKWIRRRK